MTTNYHVPLTVGASNASSNWNAIYGELDSAVVSAGGGTNRVSDNYLLAHYLFAANTQVSNIVYDSTYGSLARSYDFVWGDGSPGRFDTVTIDPEFLEITDWIMVHLLSQRVLRFYGLTRDSNGNIVTPGQFAFYDYGDDNIIIIPEGCIEDRFIVEFWQTAFAESPLCVGDGGILEVRGIVVVE